MKNDIHPKYFQTTVTCACGNVIHTGSTMEDIHTEICSNCHPFYTGKQKLVDTAHRVNRFKRLQDKAKEMKAISRKPRVPKAKKVAEEA